MAYPPSSHPPHHNPSVLPPSLVYSPVSANSLILSYLLPFSYFADSFLPPSLCAHWKSGYSLSLPLYLFLSLSLSHSFPSSFSFHLVKPLEFCFNFFIGFSGCFTFLRAGVRVSNTALILSSPGLSLCHWLFCSHDFSLPPPVIVCLHATAFINSSQVFEFLSKGHDRRQGEYRLHHSALPT